MRKLSAFTGPICDNLADGSNPKSKKDIQQPRNQAFLGGRQEKVSRAEACLLAEEHKLIWDPLPGRCLWKESGAGSGTGNQTNADVSLEGMTR